MKTESKQLTVIERASVALGASECEKQLTELVEESKGITTITNPAGRDECHTSAMKATKARTGITTTGKAARDDANAFSKAIIEPEEIRLKSLRDVWDAKIEAEKVEKARIEAERQDGIQSRIDVIRNMPSISILLTAQQLLASLDKLAAIEITTAIFDDRSDEAEYVMAQSVHQIEAMIVNRRNLDATLAQAEAQRVENERIAAELAAQHAEAERMQREALKAEADRQRVQAEELAKRRAEIEAMQRQLAEQQAEVDRQRVAAANKAQFEAQAAQRDIEQAARVADAEAAQRTIDEAKSVQQSQIIDADHAKAIAIEESRLRVQCAEQERSCEVVPEKSPIDALPAPLELIEAIADSFCVELSVAVFWLNKTFNNCLRDRYGNRSIFDDVDE